jgi:hypothetical protein
MGETGGSVILAIDPGPTESAFVFFEPALTVSANGGPSLHCLGGFGKVENHEVFAVIERHHAIVVIEMIASYGMPVGREVFETCVWIGRYEHAARERHGVWPERLSRGAVKVHLCNSMRAKDGNVRQALIDRFGGDSHAIGKKKTPGPLYGVSGDVWAALAVAVTYAERTEAQRAA